MNQRLWVFTLLAPFLMGNVVFAKKSGARWGKYEGEMKWDDATKRCKTKGMRLPSIKELQEAYPKITNKWSQRGAYWSATLGLKGGSKDKGMKDYLKRNKVDNSFAWLLAIDIGLSNAVKMTDGAQVRCVR